jgi:hypothetical protein
MCIGISWREVKVSQVSPKCYIGLSYIINSVLNGHMTNRISIVRGRLTAKVTEQLIHFKIEMDFNGI